jgi:hypothetical protein
MDVRHDPQTVPLSWIVIENVNFDHAEPLEVKRIEDEVCDRSNALQVYIRLIVPAVPIFIDQRDPVEVISPFAVETLHFVR